MSLKIELENPGLFNKFGLFKPKVLGLFPKMP